MRARGIVVAVLAAMLFVGEANAQNEATGAGAATPASPAAEGAPIPAAGTAPASPAEAAHAANPVTAYKAHFASKVLSGDAYNELLIPLPLAQVGDLFSLRVEWDPKPAWAPGWACPAGPSEGSTADRPPDVSTAGRSQEQVKYLYAKKSGEENGVPFTSVQVYVPRTLCWLPAVQIAKLTIGGEVKEGTSATAADAIFFNEQIGVSVLWLPLAATILAVVLIYPGCALISLMIRRRRVRRETPAGEAPKLPGFWASLDPVQITANAYGRGSLQKMQIFVFTLVIFEALLFFQLRNRVLGNISLDILYLLGISAAGTVAGHAAFTAKRRLSFDNWAWLRRRSWLPPGSDSKRRASWGDLFTDYQTKEFDLYSFQMAIFSVVVAVALVSTNVTGLEAFTIPPQLLALLGMSQIVYVGGKAVGTSAYQELDQKLTELRKIEREFAQARQTSDAAKTQEAQTKFEDSWRQAAEMFWALYGPELGEVPPGLRGT